MPCQNNLNDPLPFAASTRRALADLHIIFPDLSPLELVEHAVQQAWARNLDRIEAARAGTINQAVGA